MKLRKLLFPEVERKSNLSNSKIYKANGEVKNVSAYNMQHFYSKADMQMIKNAEVEMIEIAQEKADKIMAEAKVTAQEIIENAKNESTCIRKESKESGYKEGYNQAAIEIKEKLEDSVDAIEKIRDHMFSNIGMVYDQVRDQIIDLSIEIAQKIIQRKVELDRDIIVEMVLNCLKLTKDKTEIVIKVNPLDYEMIDEKKELFYRKIRGVQSVIVEETESVLEGGCIVETQSGDISADISEQLLKIKEAITE